METNNSETPSKSPLPPPTQLLDPGNPVVFMDVRINEERGDVTFFTIIIPLLIVSFLQLVGLFSSCSLTFCPRLPRTLEPYVQEKKG